LRRRLASLSGCQRHGRRRWCSRREGSAFGGVFITDTTLARV